MAESRRDGHPIRELVAELLVDGSAGQEAAVLPAEAIARIGAEIDKHIGRPDLIDVVETILSIAEVIELEQKSPRCAGYLCDLVERDVVIGALKDLNRAKGAKYTEEVEKAADKFTGFTGSESQKKAPAGDARAPKGSIKVGSLSFPKKL